MSLQSYSIDMIKTLTALKINHMAKRNTAPFVPTKRTVIQQIAGEVSRQCSNKRTLHKIEEENGGLFANLPSDIPRNERQVRYIRSKQSPSSVDPIMEIMNLKEGVTVSFNGFMLTKKRQQLYYLMTINWKVLNGFALQTKKNKHRF